MIEATASAKRHPGLASWQQPGKFMNFTPSPAVHFIRRVRLIRKARPLRSMKIQFTRITCHSFGSRFDLSVGKRL